MSENIPHITRYDVQRHISELSMEKPGVYTRLESDGSGCVNTEVDPGTGKIVPSCLVGSVLSRIIGVQNVPSCGSSEDTLNTLIEEEKITIDDDARFLLGVAQSMQDTLEISWRSISTVVNDLLYHAKNYSNRKLMEKNSGQ